MKILFIGGNGNISWYCVQKALERGHDVWELNRAQTLSTRRKIQKEVNKITADIHNKKAMNLILADSQFDIVVDFICFNRQDALNDIELFAHKTKHFVFISSEAIYKRAGKNLPFKENCEVNALDKVSKYIGGKIEAEEAFMTAYRNVGFPVTIVRPSYTYDTIVPVSIGHNCFTAPNLFLQGYPALIAGDGTNLWSFTHSKDFANAFIPLIEQRETIGQAFHITTNEWLSWNEEMEILFNALGIKEYRSIHVPYKEALELDYFQPKDLMGQRMWHNIYDTSKVREYVPDWKAKISFEEGIKETIEWLFLSDVHRRINPNHESELKRLYKLYGE